MGSINEFKNKHLGEDIYVIGSGKTLDFLEMDFFDGKITVGINQVFKKVQTTYLVRKEPPKEEYIEATSGTIHMISRGARGNVSDENLQDIKQNLGGYNNIYVFGHEQNVHKLTKLPANDDHLVVSFSTITSGIHLAAYMGAKNIILVGHDCGTLNDEPYFTGYHTNATRCQKTDAGYVKWLAQIEQQTITLKRLLKEKYGCNVYSLNPFINYGLEGNVYKK